MACLAVLVGCRSQQHVIQQYDGGARPSAEVATLWYFADSRIVLGNIDNRGPEVVHHCTRKDACIVQVLPGKHTMKVAFTEEQSVHTPEGDFLVNFGSDSKVVSFEVEAGKFYSITGTRGSLEETARKNIRGLGSEAKSPTILVPDAVVGLASSKLASSLGAGIPHVLGDDDWTVKVELSGDPDHPVEQ
jgi:hypothetical protein